MSIPDASDTEDESTNSSDSGRLRAVASANTYRGLQPWLGSTGLRNHELRNRALGQTQQARTAEEFLMASRIRREDARVPMSTRPYFTDSGLTTVSLIDTDTVSPGREGSVPLPTSTDRDAPVNDVIATRRSGRQFSGAALNDRELASLVRGAVGRTGSGRVLLSNGDKVTVPYHAAPSGGGLRPVSVHVAALAVDGLPNTIMRYDAREDVLISSDRHPPARDLLDTCLSPPDLEYLPQAAVIFLFVGRPWRSMRKYGDRGVRFLLLEAGAMAQNVHLTATALELPNVACGALCDDEVHGLLGIDGVHELVVHAVAVGRAPEISNGERSVLDNGGSA